MLVCTILLLKSSVLSSFLDLIALIKLEATIYYSARICGDWKLSASSTGRTCFHMAIQGKCVMEVPDYGNWQLDEGDLVIFPRELQHSLIPTEPLPGTQKHLPISESQHIPGTSMVCGEVRFMHRGSENLLDILPAVIVIKRDENTGWLTHFLNLILCESLQVKNNNHHFINTLSELLFGYALRYLVEQNLCEGSLLALYSHSQLSQAIKQIHEKPEQAWTLALLAKHAAMSRTHFTETFKKVSGWTPIRYLTWWRMQLAWSLLKEDNPVAVVAEQVGYQSEAAFSRAFQKAFKVSAGEVRRSTIS